MKDDNAVVFGEDVAFGGVFRCTMVSSARIYANDLTILYLEVHRALQKSLVSAIWLHLFRSESLPRKGARLQHTIDRARYCRLRYRPRNDGPYCDC